MQFILFSSAINFKEEIELVNYFLLDIELVFHIRKPELSFKELESYINKIPEKHHCQLVIHQHLELLNKFNLKGYHCTRYFLKNKTISLSKLKANFPNYSFSRSCHSLSELNDIEDYSYVFLSPIFNSISKEGYTSPFNLKEVNELIKNRLTPVYALGGISEKSVRQLTNSYFKGVGVLGYIWESNTPTENYNKVKKALLFN